MITDDRELFALAEEALYTTTQAIIKGGLPGERFKILAAYTAGTLGSLAEVIGRPEPSDIAEANQVVNCFEHQVLGHGDPAFGLKEWLLLVQLQAMATRLIEYM